MLIGDQQRTSERSVFRERSVYDSCRAGSELSKDAARRLAATKMNRRTLGRWRGNSDDRRTGKNECERAECRLRPQDCDRCRDEARRYSDPGKAGESRQQTGYISEICGGDERQLCSSSARPMLAYFIAGTKSFARPRNQSRLLHRHR
jgi:hypothetical protein